MVDPPSSRLLAQPWSNRERLDNLGQCMSRSREWSVRGENPELGNQEHENRQPTNLPSVLGVD